MHSIVSVNRLCSEIPPAVPQAQHIVQKPVFFGAAKSDYVALAAIGKFNTSQLCPNATVREFDTGHWVTWEAKDEVNKELLSWIQAL